LSLSVQNTANRSFARAKRIADVSMIQLFVMRRNNQPDSREIIDAAMRYRPWLRQLGTRG
jgi:hypothetical protein